MTTALLWLALTGVPDIPPGPTAWTLRPMVESVADAYRIPRAIAVGQAFAESSFVPTAAARKWVRVKHKWHLIMSRGLFQINRDNEAELVHRAGLRHFDWRNPMQSAIVGLSYLSRLKTKYGDWERALAAYNFGPGNVDKGKPWPRETVEYVRRILR